MVQRRHRFDRGLALLRQITWTIPGLAYLGQLAGRFIDQDVAAGLFNTYDAFVRLYGPASTASRGGTVTFNLCDRRGDVFRCAEVEAEARRAGVSVRGGCFCNPGASEVAFGLEAARILACVDTLGAGFTPEAHRPRIGYDSENS